MTTSTAPTTSGPTTTTTGPALLESSQPAGIPAPMVGAVLPVLGVLYLVRGALPAGGRHARRRRAHRLRHRG
jgi:hypothetical protein